MLKNTAIAICVLAAADASKLTGRHSQSLKMKLRNRMGESQTDTTKSTTQPESYSYYDAAYSYYSNYNAEKGQYYAKSPTYKTYNSYDSVSGDSNGYYEGKYSYSYDYSDNVYSYQGGYQYYGGKGAWWSKSVGDEDNKWGYDQTEYNFSGGYYDTDGSGYYSSTKKTYGYYTPTSYDSSSTTGTKYWVVASCWSPQVSCC